MQGPEAIATVRVPGAESPVIFKTTARIFPAEAEILCVSAAVDPAVCAAPELEVQFAGLPQLLIDVKVGSVVNSEPREG
jgi:hypothetical protein